MFKVVNLIGICVQEKGEVLVVEIMYGGGFGGWGSSTLVMTMVDAGFLESWASVVNHLGGWGRWMPGLKS